VVVVAVAILLVMVPINSIIRRNLGKMWKQTSTMKDDRIKILNEVINGIKVSRKNRHHYDFVQCY
jgi:hypothetical protein